MSLSFEFQEQFRAIEESIQKDKQVMKLTPEINQSQNEVCEGYVPEKKEAPDHGEPWNEQTADMNKGVHWLNTEQFNRAVTCVNACTGMTDPSAEIQAMREAREVKELIKQALAKLKHFLP